MKWSEPILKEKDKREDKNIKINARDKGSKLQEAKESKQTHKQSTFIQVFMAFNWSYI